MSDPTTQAPRGALRLTEDHIRRATHIVDGPLYPENWTFLSDAELDQMAVDLTRERPRPIPIFAYGSLIWNPGFAVAGRYRATAIGWHRQFSIPLDHFRGTPETPASCWPCRRATAAKVWFWKSGQEPRRSRCARC